MEETQQREKYQEPGPQGHNRGGLKFYQELPEEVGPLQVVDEAEQSQEERERGDIGPDPGNPFIFFSAQEISQC